MKRSPKTQLRFVAAALLVLAANLLVGPLLLLRPYHQIFDQPWQNSFVSEVHFNYYKTIFRQISFIVFPLIGGLQAWAAWIILKCAKRMPDTVPFIEKQA